MRSPASLSTTSSRPAWRPTSCRQRCGIRRRRCGVRDRGRPAIPRPVLRRATRRTIRGRRNPQSMWATARDAIGDLDAIERAAASWRATYADPLIAGVTPGAPTVVDNATAERGKAEFDRLRGLFDVQNEHLSAARQAGVDELHSVRAWRDRVLAGLIVAFFAMAILLAVLVRNAVTRPLAALAAACRRITEGNFGRTHYSARPQGHSGYRARRREHATAHRRRTRGDAVSASESR